MALFCTGTICTYQFTLFCTGSITSSNLGWHAATSSKHPSQPLQWTHVGNLGKFWEIASYLVDPGRRRRPRFSWFYGRQDRLGGNLGPKCSRELPQWSLSSFGRFCRLHCSQTHKHTKCTDLNNTRPSCIMSRKAWRQNLLSLSGET